MYKYINLYFVFSKICRIWRLYSLNSAEFGGCIPAFIYLCQKKDDKAYNQRLYFG